ncbi:glycosyltransferase family 4 protein [Thalassoroseus pseudoceratinae]|uniref:glycosyltransferase family 4 protein n=1 Tax=Thalassoroseus pseudoceratinae TaxID=2713176 RepID=UPI00141FDDDD|nr:glycosyltransferase family 1 protein [Thalassoroseus pseudoceratinae]
MRVFMECTATYQQDWHTGIQRVVRNLVNASRTIGPEMEIDCQPVVYDARRGMITIDGLQVHGGHSPADTAVPRNTIRRVKSTLKRLGLLRLAQRADLIRRRAVDWGFSSLRSDAKTQIDFQSGDVVVMLDGTWQAPYWRDLEQARRQGAKVGVLIHDVFPLTIPQFYPAHTTNVFRNWWLRACQSADFLVCATRAVAADVQSVLPTGTNPQIGFFRLGMELDGVQTGSAVRSELSEFFQRDTPTYLAVGTLSPRKNVSLLLDAFDRMDQQTDGSQLVIVGGEGWDAEALVRRIQSHPEYGQRLRWFDDLNDGELDFCYKHATAMVTASNAEGFNLPIVEALSRGCPVLASDVPVHREVGGRWAKFFPANDADALTNVLSDPATLAAMRSSLDGYHWPNWQESCRELLTTLYQMEAPASKAA